LLELSRTTRADAVVLDLSLPDVSGLEVVRILRDEQGISPSTPILLLTSGIPTRSERLEAYRAGAWELLSEPHDIETLVLKLELYVRAKRVADRTVESGLLDSQTGLYNARGIARRAREIGGDAQRRGAAISCMVFSARFETHAPDDADYDLEAMLLHRLSDACRTTARVSDVVGRLGRSELALIAPDTTTDGAETLIRRIRSYVESTPLDVGSTPRLPVLQHGLAVVEDFSSSTSDVIAMVLRAAGDLRDERRRPVRSTSETALSG
jgi:diguanylate cyclase (GGDEF)-like protein